MSGLAEKLNIPYQWEFVYGMFGFAEKLYLQNCENSTGNYVQYICTESNDLLKY